ncbi:MAG: type IV pilus assembly protein PilM [Candidatus Moranbacteria bacterium]|nr:type IV pilus assembly protein PilM [Candidatus Moranbacteria bacterium]
MFKFFKTKKNHFLGVDFGTSAIKVVELAYKNSQITLSNYGWVDFGSDENSGKMNYENKKEKLIKYLEMLLKEMKVKSDSVYTAIPAHNGLSVIVNFPDISDEEIAKAIKLEAGKHIPSPLDEVYLSWDVVLRDKKKGGIFDKAKDRMSHKEGEKKKESIEVMLVAAPKEEVLNYEDIIKGCGLKVKSLELDIFSIVRSVIGEDLGTYLIVDIGSRATNIILVDKGIVRINRSLSVGGNEITNTIKSSMSVTWDRAERFKKKPRDFFSSKEAVSILPILSSISSEAKRIINEYSKKNPEKKNPVDSVIISGGTSLLTNLDSYFAKELGVKVVSSNPWKRVKVKDPLLEERLSEMAPSFSVAIGLALKGVDDYCRDI